MPLRGYAAGVIRGNNLQPLSFQNTPPAQRLAFFMTLLAKFLVSMRTAPIHDTIFLFIKRKFSIYKYFERKPDRFNF